ncbi:MAG: cytochrome C oxidase subunit IV family protein [Acidobacteria bacterium]|nr:cytochrome C oxidase subunit IV family protein [Acidobacteriota bacterium]
MHKTHTGLNYRLYWSTWLVLLALTVTMILIGSAPIPRLYVVLLLGLAMLAKASLISGYFMHLRFERSVLVWTVGAGILLTGAILFIIIVPDGLRIMKLSRP